MALALGCLFEKWPWPWGACWGRCLEGLEGVWRVWKVLDGLEGFGGFGVFAGWQTVPLKAHRKLCCGLGPGVPVGEVALALGCLLGRVFGGFGRFWRVWRVLEGVWRVWKVLRVWRVWRVLEGVWRVWRVLEGLEGFGAFGVFAGWQTAALKANRKPLLWPWPWGACLRSGLGPGVPVGEGVWRVWRVFGGFGGFWRVWRVLERLECLRAGKRYL